MRTALTILLVLAIGVVTAGAQEPPSLVQARAFYDAGKLDDARQVLETLMRSGTQDPDVFLLAGVVDRTAGRLDSAIESLEQARTLAPDAVPVAVELATTLAWNRDLAPAIAIFRQVLAGHPDDVGARNGLGFALAWQGRLDEAHAIFTSIAADDPSNVSAWSGIGVVERARFNRPAATAAYRAVVELEPGNADAHAALEALRWDRQGESRVLAGFSTAPGAEERFEGRMQTSYAIDPRVTLSGAYQHYAFGADPAVAGGGVLVGTRKEDSLEGGVVFRPSNRATLAASLYTFFSEEQKRGIVWIEGVMTLFRGVSVIGNVRPAFSSEEPKQLWAWALGGSVSLPHQHQVSARVLVANDTEYEPRLTLLSYYNAVLSRRISASIGVAYSNTDERFEFTSVTANATYLVAPAFGLFAEGSRRTGTAERSTLLAGIILRH